MTYVDGFLLPVPAAKLDEYRAMAQKASAIWIDHGALQYMECVGEDLDEKGPCATFPNTMALKTDEVPVFAFIVYSSREVRDAVNAKVMADPRINEMCTPDNMPFDVSRMAYGGFKAIVEAIATR
ncbi:DUF1428 domain-containing protein [Micavibrio aeruginosavorus]|uniref:DUF1428 domain-containing protein n=1 Tax=Micavibrio aeruginosavorus TaxID=349221 RepID=UPI003F4AF069